MISKLFLIVVHVELSVAEIIVPVVFGDLPDHAAGVASGDHVVGNVLCDDASACYNDIVADGYSRHYADVAANPDVVAYCDVDAVFIA